jgi:hypothetical protein
MNVQQRRIAMVKFHQRRAGGYQPERLEACGDFVRRGSSRLGSVKVNRDMVLACGSS